MLAEESQSTPSEEERSSVVDKNDNPGQKNASDVFANIFAGLTFPDAPTNTDVWPRRNAGSAPLKEQEEDMIELLETNDLSSFVETDEFPICPETQSQTSGLDENSQVEPPSSVVPGYSVSSVQKPKVTLTSQQFDALYGQDDTATSPKGGNMYPSLQSLLSSSNHHSTQLKNLGQEKSNGYSLSKSTAPPPAYNVNYIEEDQTEEDTEKTPFLSREEKNTKNAESSAPHSYLAMENERLQRELHALRSAMSISGQSTANQNYPNTQSANTQNHQFSSPVVISNASESWSSVQTTSSTTQQNILNEPPLDVTQIQQRQLQIQQQAQQNRQQSSSTASGNATVKYVCCGSCRQWLSSPRDATFVYCPGCGAVNNCNVRPTDACKTSSERPTNAAPTRRVGERSPWYLQCVEGWF